MAARVTAQTRKELVARVRSRYQAGSRYEKARILDEFVATAGCHRKSVVRLLNGSEDVHGSGPPRARPRVYDEAVLQGLVILWEASDRICGKRLKALLPLLLPALERNGHLQLEPATRTMLTEISAATIDRLLREVRSTSDGNRARRAPTALRRSVPIRAFADWGETNPGFMEMDLVAHCGGKMAGSFVHTLSLTDVSSGWTERVPLLVRDSVLVMQGVEGLRTSMPFSLRGLDVDNGSEFLNETTVRYCATHDISYTRSRPYLKNDQAWIEQKNGSVVRRLVGYRRLQGMAAAGTLGRLYAASRLFVNFFQPSFKLKDKCRIGARVTKHYYPPETPASRLLTSGSVSEQVKANLQGITAKLDPLQLLDEIRKMQQRLVELADAGHPPPVPSGDDDLTRFLSGLATAWRQGEVRATHAARVKKGKTLADAKEPIREGMADHTGMARHKPRTDTEALAIRRPTGR